MVIFTSQNQSKTLASLESRLHSLYVFGGVSALLQLASILTLMVVMMTLGTKPETAQEYFNVYQESKLAGLLRGDLLLLVLIGLYVGTFPALYAALHRINPVYSALATVFTLMAVVGTFATESTFSLMRLSEQFAAAGTEAERSIFLAAGEAVIASDMWHSSGAYMGGILLQGSGVMISLIMLKSKDFSKVTAYTGLLGNGFDLIQHILHPFAPSVSGFISAFMGLFYFVWYPMLTRDFFRLARQMREG